MDENRIYAMINEKKCSREVSPKALKFLINYMNQKRMIPPDFYSAIIPTAEELFGAEETLTLQMAVQCCKKCFE